MNQQKPTPNRSLEIKVGLVLVLIVVAIFAYSDYGLKKKFQAQLSPVSFSYSVKWYADESVIDNVVYARACARDDMDTGSICDSGVRVAVYSSLETWLAKISTPANETLSIPAETFQSLDQYIAKNKNNDFGTASIGGHEARVYDVLSEEGSGHILKYNLVVNGRLYDILVPSTSSPEYLTHGQEVVLNSIQFGD